MAADGEGKRIDPISQFEITPMAEWKVGSYDLSFTNSSLMMLIAVGLILLWLFLSTGRRSLVPGRWQSIVELSYEFIGNMIRSTAGSDGLRFFPFVFSLFMFILFANMLGMIPFFFTTTSHIVVTFTLAMMVMCLVIGYGVYRNGWGFLRLFWPSGIPLAIVWFVAILEVISFMSRPISLSVRLWANMLAGHILLKLFAGFAVMMVGAFGLFPGVFGALIPFAMTFALVPLEFLVAFVQAYVFALLTCVYLSDALHPGHH
ncbi:MAG: F0F1 ATP synthase subunit A [Hyphomonadaceae bacterium]|nr:F0F1 ATP synthase subunit A [Hyphomonadaceae bacterium]MBC6412103.1 F0F1 ATP synthase subunit A [Hyphomonadaceae bacterium]